MFYFNESLQTWLQRIRCLELDMPSQAQYGSVESCVRITRTCVARLAWFAILVRLYIFDGLRHFGFSFDLGTRTATPLRTLLVKSWTCATNLLNKTLQSLWT